MQSLTLEWLAHLGKSLVAYLPLPVALGLVVVAAIIWMLFKRHRPESGLDSPPLIGPNPASIPLPILRGISGEFNGSAIELTDEPVLIGRDPKVCQLVFPTQLQEISKRHCIVRFHAKSQCFLLVDCNSANGTFVANGERLPNGGSQLLNAGQRFFLSSPENMFEVNFQAPR